MQVKQRLTKREPVLRRWLAAIALAAVAAVAVVALAAPPGPGIALWQDLPPGQMSAGPPVTTSRHRGLHLDEEGLLSLLATAPREGAAEGIELALPSPDGGFARYRLVEAPVMAPRLAARFPVFKTFRGRGIDDPAATLRADWTHKGFHASVLSPGVSFYIDPSKDGGSRHYFSYDKNAQIIPASRRLPDTVIPTATKGSSERAPAASVTSFGTQIRVYRTAVAATGEYTDYHGGTVLDGMAAIVTTINRVTQVYERDLASRLELVADNDLVVYTDAGSDPYTNSDLFAMLSENVVNLDAVIGSANYDLGHVFGTSGGGVVSGAICAADKAAGATGLGNPIGDPFYVDYVAHEMGHQMYGNHTFDNCAGSQGPAPFEPGSASTIMGYAGICGAGFDLQLNSDDHFHSYNIFDEIAPATLTGCGTVLVTGNAVPVPDAGSGSHMIPAATPFELTGSASDADGDALTYMWEEVDFGGNTSPDDPMSPPFFRSWPATTDPTRVFPRLSDLVANMTVIGEVLPDTDTTMDFRFVVRDSVGGIAYDGLSLGVAGGSGPFLVTDPDTAEVWTHDTAETVSWDVAGTDGVPVSCALVDIRLSTDGGFTYPIGMATGEANDGVAVVTVPNAPTTAGRVKVKCSDNVFFDISDTDFTIEGEPGFQLSAAATSATACAGEDAVFAIAVESVLGFTRPVTLSIVGDSGGVPGFSVNPVTPDGSSDLTISNVVDGTHLFSVEGKNRGTVQSMDLTLEVLSGALAAPGSPTPADGSVDVILPPALSWAAVAGATAYDVDIATDAAFADIVDSANVPTNSYTPALTFDGLTVYYWRVRAVSLCGGGLYAAFSFTTEDASLCSTSAVSIPDAAPDGVSQAIHVPHGGTLEDLQVQLIVDHTWVGDLDATLTHIDSGTTVLLFDRPNLAPVCSGRDIDAIFDDAASIAVDNACTASVPTIDGTVRSEEPLSAFGGLPLDSSWRLDVADYYQSDSGSIQKWCLLPTLAPPGPGETSGPSLANLAVIGTEGNSLLISFESGCDAVNNNIHYGPLDDVSSYGWSGSRCDVGAGPIVGSFNPGAGSYFFLVVGTNGGVEGSYGRNSAAVERPPHRAGVCGEIQSLPSSCE